MSSNVLSPTPAEIVETMLVPDFLNVFAIVPSQGVLTFHSQQRRAFNLVWALAETGRLRDGTRIGVIGAGLAGMTVAAAARIKGGDVTVIEEQPTPFHRQIGNHTRCIHPNILDWPDANALNEHTDLPYLNWSAQNCNFVIAEIEAQLASFDPKIDILFGSRASSVEETSDGVLLRMQNGGQRYFDCVISCVGFGREKRFGNLGGTTYWEDDPLHQFSFEPGDRVLISGTGDGGLIDLCRLVIERFDHEQVWAEIINHEPLWELAKTIAEVEIKARQKGDRAGSFFLSKYQELKIEEKMPKLRDRIKRDARVTLNGQHKDALNPNASALNRIIAYALMQLEIVDYIDGKPTAYEFDGPNIIVKFERKQEPRKLPFKRVIIRHGPEGALGSVFEDGIVDRILKPSLWMTDLGLKQFWPEGYFVPPSIGRQTIIIAERRALKYKEAAEAHLQKVLNRPVELKIEKSENGHPVYEFLYTAPIPEQSPREFARIPIQYKRHQAMVEATVTIDQTKYRPLVCGIGIQNLDLRRRSNADGIANAGTLGCFVQTNDGKAAFLSALHVFAGDVTQPARRGDIIVQAPGDTDSAASAIGRLDSYVPLQGGNQINFCDVGLATLLPKVEFVPAFLPQHQLPMPKSVAEISNIKVGEDVLLIGAANGRRNGKIRGFIASIQVGYNASIGHRPNQLLFGDCIQIEHTPIRSPGGDSGGLVMRRDGTILGMIFAGNSSFSIAFPLAPAMRELRCTLITFP
jgi:hypothetical protein